MGDDAEPSLHESGVELEIRPHPLAVPTFLYSPWLSIDEMLPTKFGWGTHFVSLSMGSHSLSCGLGNRSGDRIEVHIPRDDVVSATWRGPSVAGMNGRWTIRD
jgi:hypothetical protein